MESAPGSPLWKELQWGISLATLIDHTALRAVATVGGDETNQNIHAEGIPAMTTIVLAPATTTEDAPAQELVELAVTDLDMVGGGAAIGCLL